MTNLYFSIYHELNCQRQLEASVDALRALGLSIAETAFLPIDEIQKWKEEVVNEKSKPLWNFSYIFGEMEMDYTINSVDNQIVKFVDSILSIFETAVVVVRYNTRYLGLRSVYAKGKPSLHESVVIYPNKENQGAKADIALKTMGYSNIKYITYDNIYDEWEQVDFDSNYIWDHLFQDELRHLTGAKAIELFHGTKGWVKESEYKIGFKVIKRNTFFDYSGDDSSLDPRHW